MTFGLTVGYMSNLNGAAKKFSVLHELRGFYFITALWLIKEGGFHAQADDENRFVKTST